MPTPAEAMYPNGPSNALGGDDKWAFRKKLLSDPKERDVLYRYTHAEVGGQGRKAAQAFMEVVTNRADAEGKSVSQVLTGTQGAHSGSDYYPAITHMRAGRAESTPDYDSVAQDVANGSNIANYGTGNASGTVGFAKGPRTARHGDENFGIEGWNMAWAKSKGYTGQYPVESTDREPIPGVKTRTAEGLPIEDDYRPPRRQISLMNEEPIPMPPKFQVPIIEQG